MPSSALSSLAPKLLNILLKQLWLVWLCSRIANISCKPYYKKDLYGNIFFWVPDQNQDFMYDLFVDSNQVQFSCLLCFSRACGVLWTWSCSCVSSSEAVSESSNEQNLFCLWVSLILSGQCRPCLSERQRSLESSTSEPFSDSRSHSAGVCHLLFCSQGKHCSQVKVGSGKYSCHCSIGFLAAVLKVESALSLRGVAAWMWEPQEFFEAGQPGTMDVGLFLWLLMLSVQGAVICSSLFLKDCRIRTAFLLNTGGSSGGHEYIFPSFFCLHHGLLHS